MSDNPAEMPAQVGGFEVANRGPADDGPLSDIGEALKAFAQGEILVVVDDEGLEVVRGGERRHVHLGRVRHRGSRLGRHLHLAAGA